VAQKLTTIGPEAAAEGSKPHFSRLRSLARRPLIWISACALLWGVGFLVGRNSVEQYAPSPMTASTLSKLERVRTKWRGEGRYEAHEMRDFITRIVKLDGELAYRRRVHGAGADNATYRLQTDLQREVLKTARWAGVEAR
jgi:hypothetical protein